jgi:hypothetical protein
MVSAEQKQKILKAKIALSLHHEFGRVPKEQEIEYVYHIARVLHASILGTHFLRAKQKHNNQLALF